MLPSVCAGYGNKVCNFRNIKSLNGADGPSLRGLSGAGWAARTGLLRADSPEIAGPAGEVAYSPK